MHGNDPVFKHGAKDKKTEVITSETIEKVRNKDIITAAEMRTYMIILVLVAVLAVIGALCICFHVIRWMRKKPG